MLEERIRRTELLKRVMSAQEAAELIQDGDTVGISGFTRAGDVKSVPSALADRVKRTGTPVHINLYTGASVAEEVDRRLTESGLILRRLPFQSDAVLRSAINRGDIMYVDQHLSVTAEKIREGQLGKLDIAIVEAAAITEEGGIIPSTSVGNSPTFVLEAEKVIVELNLHQPLTLEGIHDIYVPEDRPHRLPLPLTDVKDRLGTSYIPVDSDKIAAIVITDQTDHFAELAPADEDTQKIAQHLIDFLEGEVRCGRLPQNLRPLQSGVGSIANAVLHGLLQSSFKGLEMYSEVLQDAAFELLDAGKMTSLSGCSITVSPERAARLMEDFSDYRDRVVLRPQEISNHPGIIRQLGIIAINTALEVDIYGNVNSTHVTGTDIVNGIGGSGDFARNASLSIFVTKSTAKRGAVSCIVPMVSHVDHTEHDVDVIVTEYGLADLRGLAPRERAKVIIENCVNPYYQSQLRSYFQRARSRGGHTPHLLEEALSWHIRYRETGTMMPERQGEVDRSNKRAAVPATAAASGAMHFGLTPLVAAGEDRTVLTAPVSAAAPAPLAGRRDHGKYASVTGELYSPTEGN